MSRVITFSRVFPSYHPRKGEPTYFVEKVVKSLHWDRPYPPVDNRSDFDSDIYINCKPKHHTIRAGHRWKVGDKFSPRVWSGKPYASKQIQFAPDVEIKQIWDVEFDGDGCLWIFSDKERGPRILHTVAKNDGLSLEDLMSWFNKPFTGQVICWNEKINY